MAASGVTMAQLEQQKAQQTQQVAPKVDSSTSNFLGLGGKGASLVNLGGMTTPPGVKAATVRTLAVLNTVYSWAISQ